MFNKHVSELGYEDLDQLVNVRHEQEGLHLDFKAEFNSNPDKARSELAKDISAFANANGGYLVIGVSETREINGIDDSFSGKPIVEWINQVVNSNVEPSLFYHDPKIVHIPNSNKIVVIIHIPESSNKPHIHIPKSVYYMRVNDSNKSANHYQIRDMFEFSRNRHNDFLEFVKKRKLHDEDASNYGENRNSKKLHRAIPPEMNRDSPFVLFSMIP